jgi:hypothetical protein
VSDLIRTLHETAHYPPHPPRKPTSLYLKTHKRLVEEEDRPCLVCGVRHSTMNDPARNRWGAIQIELHHHVIEDSLANAIDLAKFNKRVLPGLLRQTGNHSKYGHEFTQEEMIEWIHGDEGNLWPLCDVHHRHPLVGIHAITFPVWTAQDLLVDNFDLTGFEATGPVEAAHLAALPTTTGTPQVSS